MTAEGVGQTTSGKPDRRGSGLPAALATAAVVGLLAAAGVFSGPERASLTARFQLRGPRPLRAPVAIAAIDDASLARYGQMPWSREVFARLIDRLGAMGAAAIGFDVAFVEPGRRQPGEDAALARAMARYGRVVLAVYRPLQSGYSVATPLVRPVSMLASASAAFGLAHFSTLPTFDVWQIEPEQPAGPMLVPTLGLAVARLAAARDPALHGAEAAAWGRSAVALNFAGPAGSIPTYSVRDLLAGRVPARAIAGHAIFVGATAAGMPDTGFSIPFAGPEPGVEIHATSCENFLAGDALEQLPWPIAAALWLLLALLAGPQLARAGGTPRARLLWLAGSLAVVLGAAWEGFVRSWLLPVAAPIALVSVSALVGILRQEGQLLRERARLLGWYAFELKREAKRQREQIDGELHDEAQQLLISMGRQLRRMRRRIDDPGLAEVEGLTQRVLDEIIRVRKALVPRTLSRDGLVPAIAEMARDLTDRGGPLVDFRADGWPRTLDPMLESELYWLVKEALNNAAKHAQAQTIEIALSARDDRLTLAIADDGKGFVPGPIDRPPDSHEHTGLHRMWVRARGLGGNLAVESAPGSGSRLVFSAPRRLSAPALPAEVQGTL